MAKAPEGAAKWVWVNSYLQCRDSILVVTVRVSLSLLGSVHMYWAQKEEKAPGKAALFAGH